MNAPHPIRSPFVNRTVDCPECGGSGMRMGCNREIECFDCGGEGQWTASCAECGEDNPINDDGICEQCAMLTICVGDPLLRRAM